jgi:hypothetical protein
VIGALELVADRLASLAEPQAVKEGS